MMVDLSIYFKRFNQLSLSPSQSELVTFAYSSRLSSLWLFANSPADVAEVFSTQVEIVRVTRALTLLISSKAKGERPAHGTRLQVHMTPGHSFQVVSSVISQKNGAVLRRTNGLRIAIS